MSLDWTNAFAQTYEIIAIAVDDVGVASAYFGVGDTVRVELDSDGDGIPDWWMLQHFGHPTGEAGDSSLASDDLDGDGVSNLREYQRGSDPSDYYNGNLPNLEILSGNDQGGNYDSFLPFSVIIGVTDANSDILTNAPVTFTVTNGTALLAATTNDTQIASLALRTDTNGQASVWVYFPPRGSNPPDSMIVVSSSSGANSTAVTVNEYVPLAHWTFNDTNTWIGEAGQLPLLTNNLAGGGQHQSGLAYLPCRGNQWQ